MPYSSLGILCTRRKDYKKAIKYFKEACNRTGRNDLTIQSNLAEAYLRAGQVYKAIFHLTEGIKIGEGKKKKRGSKVLKKKELVPE